MYSGMMTERGLLTVIIFALLSISQGLESCSEPCLIYTARNRIDAIELASSRVVNLASNLTFPVDIAVDVRERTFYWSDINQRVIKRMNMSSGVTKDIITEDHGYVGDLAVEWESHLLYWTDPYYDRIEVASLDGSKRKVLFADSLSNPVGIAVHPKKGWMFWTDTGLTSKIERATLAGFERTVLVDLTKSSQFWPYAICVDYTNDRIVWVDAFTSAVDSADLQGKNRRIVASQVPMYPNDFILYGDTFYWSDWRESTIEMLNWTTGDYLGNFSSVISDRVYGLSLLDQSRQPASAGNQLCKMGNGGCSHLCLLTPNGSLCACPDGFPLSTDGKRCLTDIKTFLLFAEGSHLRQLAFNVTSSRRIPLKIQASQPMALDFDFVEGKVYWTDVSLGTISRAYLNGSFQETVVTGGLQHPYGLAVDPFGQNIYWTDSTEEVIGIASKDGLYRRVLIKDNLQDPRDMILDVTRGYMYWTDWGWDERIERADMDGTNRRVIVRSGLLYPNGLTLDFLRNWLYWIDSVYGKLEVYEFPSKTRRTIIPAYGEPFLKSPLGLTLYGSYFFWTDQRLNGIYRADRDTGGNASKVLSTSSRPALIHAYDRNMNITPVTDQCANQSDGCSHFCLLTPSGPKCLCSEGFNLHDDGKGCEAPRGILLYADYSYNKIMKVTPNATGSLYRLPLSNIRRPIALDYDVVEDRVYWTDSSKISRSFLNGSSQEIIIDTNSYSRYGLAVDSVGRNLYWTDYGSGAGMVEVSKLDGSRRMALVTHNLNQPRDIILDVYKGVMYWTDRGNSPKIERADMTGRNRVVVVSSSLYRPNGLTLDRKRNRLYWIDAGYAKLEYLDMNQNKRVLLLSYYYNLYYSFGLTLLGDYLYWTSSSWSRGVYRADKDTGSGITRFVSSTGSLRGIRGYDLSEPFTKGNSSCLGDCSHICVLSPNGSECACPIHFTLGEDKKTCEHDVPQKILLFADSGQRQIYTLSLDESNMSSKSLPKAHQNYRPVALDFDITEDRIYWTDIWSNTISRMFINGSSPEVVVSRGVYYPYGLAVDPMGKNIYWTDHTLNKIEVCRMDGSIRKTLISRDLDNPRDIIVDLNEGLMYWSDWGASHKIEVASMDGNNRSALVRRGLYWPNGLTLDGENNRLYWVDAWFHILEYYDLERHTIKSLFRDRYVLRNPFGLTLLEDNLYWTDSSLGVVYKSQKDSPSNATVLVSGLSRPYDIHAYDRNRTFPDHPCSFSFGGCSHLCLVRPKGYKCACPDNLELSKDDKTCIPQTYIFQKFLLFADASHAEIYIVDLDDSNFLAKALPIGAYMYRPVALGMDLTDNRVYWTDVSLNSIRRAFINGTSPEIVVSVNVSHSDGLAVDPVGGNIYWSDTVTKRIEVSRMDGTMRKVLIDKDLDQPRDIILYLTERLVYWCDWGNVPKIEVANMDGYSRRILVERGLYWPNGLTLDEANNRLYWVDAYFDILEYYDLEHQTITTLMQDSSKLPHPFGLTLLEDHLYWTDWRLDVVHRAEKKTLSTMTVVVSGLGQPMDIHAYDRNKPLPDHPCSKSYGGCSHLCLLRPDGYRCSCPDYLQPGENCSTSVHLHSPPSSSKPQATTLQTTRQTTRQQKTNKPPATTPQTTRKTTRQQTSNKPPATTPQTTRQTTRQQTTNKPPATTPQTTRKTTRQQTSNKPPATTPQTTRQTTRQQKTNKPPATTPQTTRKTTRQQTSNKPPATTPQTTRQTTRQQTTNKPLATTPQTTRKTTRQQTTNKPPATTPQTTRQTTRQKTSNKPPATTFHTTRQQTSNKIPATTLLTTRKTTRQQTSNKPSSTTPQTTKPQTTNRPPATILQTTRGQTTNKPPVTTLQTTRQQTSNRPPVTTLKTTRQQTSNRPPATTLRTTREQTTNRLPVTTLQTTRQKTTDKPQGSTFYTTTQQSSTRNQSTPSSPTDCRSSKCKNGGSCVIPGFFCECPKYYVWDLCLVYVGSSTVEVEVNLRNEKQWISYNFQAAVAKACTNFFCGDEECGSTSKKDKKFLVSDTKILGLSIGGENSLRVEVAVLFPSVEGQVPEPLPRATLEQILQKNEESLGEAMGGTIIRIVHKADITSISNTDSQLSAQNGKRRVENPTNSERSTQDKETFNLPIVAGLGGTVVLLVLILAFVVYQVKRKRNDAGKRTDNIYLHSDLVHSRANSIATFENPGYIAEFPMYESIPHRGGSVTSRQEQVNGVASFENNNATQEAPEKTFLSNPTYGLPFAEDPAITEDSQNRYATIEQKKTEP